MDEAVHIGVAHCHRVLDGVPAAIAVLQRRDEVDNGVKVGHDRANKEEVGDDGNLAAYAPSGFFDYLPAQGGEHLEASFAELNISGIAGIAPLKVAQYVPLRLLVGWHSSLRGNFSNPARVYI